MPRLALAVAFAIVLLADLHRQHLDRHEPIQRSLLLPGGDAPGGDDRPPASRPPRCGCPARWLCDGCRPWSCAGALLRGAAGGPAASAVRLACRCGRPRADADYARDNDVLFISGYYWDCGRSCTRPWPTAVMRTSSPDPRAVVTPRRTVMPCTGTCRRPDADRDVRERRDDDLHDIPRSLDRAGLDGHRSDLPGSARRTGAWLAAGASVPHPRIHRAAPVREWMSADEASYGLPIRSMRWDC